MKITKYLFLVLLALTLSVYAQASYSGPASGSIDTGKVISTDEFTGNIFTPNQSLRLINHSKPELLPTPLAMLNNAPREGSNFILDPNYGKIQGVDDSVIVFKEFEGYNQANSIPPDPYIAVGPNHIIITVNSNFKITDKEGNEIKSISAGQWYSKLIPGASPFDPKVIYDHYAGRWVMVWLHINENASEGYYLLSVSDDDDPTGTWYNWALPSNVDGSTPNGSWGDYQGVCFDDKAIYLTSNQFFFSGGYSNTKLRIILKDQIYTQSAGQVNFTDIWNIKYPGSTTAAFGLRPVRMYSKSDTYYFVSHSPFTIGTNFAVYSLTGIKSTPQLDVAKISVTGYSQPPDMDQLGGGSPNIDGGGFGLRNEPVYKNGKLYLVHATRVVNNGAYSGVRFLKIDLSTNTPETDFVMGAPQHYHSYPALAVDGNDNVFITYSRSSKTGYAGAYFTILPAGSEIPTGSFEMQPGKGNYVVTFGGTRNRWGDYNGAWLDPADTNSVWFYTEFVHHTNNWGTWVTGARFKPFAVPFVFAEEKNIDFGEVEIGKDTVLHKLVIRNFGSQTLDINNVALNRTDVFGMALNKSLPASLNAFDSLIIDLSFIPTSAEEIFDSVKISSNDPDDPEIVIPLHAIGFEINSAVENILYASTAPLNVSGKLLSLNESDGAGTEIGELGFPGVISLTIDPATKFIYGLIKSLDNSKIVVINSLAGDAHLVAEFPVSFLAIAHDGTGDLYGFTNDRKVYKLSLNGDHTLVSTLTKIPTVVATNPVDNQMWMFSRTGLNSGKLYKIDPNSGTEEEVSDVNLYPFALSFDNSGDLYAVYGSSSKLASIDPITGTSFDVGSTGFLRVNGLAINGDISVTFVKAISESLPTEFNLEQNYPNPFNPTTTIKYSIPQIVNGSKGISSQLVVLKIYDVLGREVATLVNEKQSPGNYEVKFDATELSSGAYIYKMTTGNFVAAKKMMLMK